MGSHPHRSASAVKHVALDQVKTRVFRVAKGLFLAHTGGCQPAADPERAADRVYLLWAENSRKSSLAPSLLLQYWLAVSMQPDSYRLQARAPSPCAFTHRCTHVAFFDRFF